MVMAKDIEIKIENKADIYFASALDDCLKIRNQRKEIYGNSWFQEDGVEANFWGGIVNKYNRLKILHKNRKEAENSYENYEDCLKDIICLSLFTLACLKAEKENLI